MKKKCFYRQGGKIVALTDHDAFPVIGCPTILRVSVQRCFSTWEGRKNMDPRLFYWGEVDGVVSVRDEVDIDDYMLSR